jgi:hypothetical protein
MVQGGSGMAPEPAKAEPNYSDHITGSGPELEQGELPWYEADNMEQEPEDGAQ